MIINDICYVLTNHTLFFNNLTRMYFPLDLFCVIYSKLNNKILNLDV